MRWLRAGIGTWRGYRQFLRVAWRASPGLSVAGALAVGLAAAAPLATAAAIGVVVGTIPDVTAGGLGSPAAGRALAWALVSGGLYLLQSAAGSVQSATATALAERIDAMLQRELMDAMLAPDGTGHLADPHILDLVNVGRDTFRASSTRPGRLAATLGGLVGGWLLLIGSCVILARLNPLLALALLATALWAAHEDRAASRLEAAHHYGSTELSRRTEYYYDLGLTPPPAKEVRVFGLRGFLVDQFLGTWRRAMVDVLAPAPRRPLVATAALGVVVVLGIVVIAAQAVAGRVSVGAATVYAQALFLSLGAARLSSWTGLQTELALASLRRYDEAVTTLAASAPPAPTVGGRPADGLPGKEIRFERVSFAYPGRPVLRELDLTIPAGRSLAIVGANGAGKTTLVKLLCRMCDPDGGRITVDGADLRELDLGQWRDRLAAVFQDSTRFEVSARSNVEFGRVAAAGEELAGVRSAARNAGIAEVLEGLPRGWETTLSAQYDGGVDLSGGEWQRLGLARALFAVAHGAGVLILDEPAAHLDARAEAELYERFLTLTAGLTTIVISHRFSTVRQASTIVVLDEGQVVEQGSHDDLVRAGRAYAEMFRLQAARFADPVPAPQQVSPR